MDGELSLLSKLLLNSALERALSRYLSRNEASREILRSLTGKVIAVNAEPLIHSLHLFPTPTGIQLQTEYPGSPDLTLTGPFLAFAKLGARGLQRRDLFSGEIEMSGDTSLAKQLQRLLEASELHWQDALGDLTSPIVVDQLAEWAQAVRDWGRNAALSLQQDLGEFLREEGREVPSKPEAEDFLSAVDRLRDDCERLEARIERLQTALEARRPAD